MNVVHPFFTCHRTVQFIQYSFECFNDLIELSKQIEFNIYLEYVFCVALCELEPHPEQFLLHCLVEGDLVAVHGAGDEPHGQVIIVRKGEEEAIKPRWMDLQDVFRN